jgi:hypothetical protein
MNGMDQPLTAQIVAREPVPQGGASGNPVEHVTLRDGRRLVCKRVSPTHDWISRATGDRGRALWMWNAGMFDRIPAPIDHTVVAVERDDDGWAIFMRDASSALIAPGRRLDRAEVRRVLAAMVELHRAFRGQQFPELCSLTDRYNLLSPTTARLEAGTHNGDAMGRAWDVFVGLAPEDVSTTILKLAEQPALLAEQLEQCEQTLIHGDVRLTNLGLAPDRVVFLDWGDRTGTAPAPVDLASFLLFDGRRLGQSREDVIADFRDLSGPDFDERAMQLSLIGGLVQLGPRLVLDIVFDNGEEAVAGAKQDLDWWTATVRHAFETTWNPA